MAALARLTPQNGMAAMQAINITVISPLFMATLFGCAALALYLGFDAWRHWSQATSPLLIFATACYVLGVIGVTMFFNVPLNDALASLDPTAASSTSQWTDYLSRWTRWNHIRFLASLSPAGFTSGRCA